MQADADYYDRLPIFDGFASIMDPARYQPLPDDWVLGLTDVVSSTKAIEDGRYKAVNTAGASVISRGLERARQGASFPSSSAATARASPSPAMTRRWRAPRSPRPRRGPATISSSTFALRSFPFPS